MYTPKELDGYFQKTRDRRILGNCHEFMHYIGWRQLHDSDGSVAVAFSKAVPTCNQGMYHGIVEEYIKRVDYNIEKAIPLLLHEVCTDIARESEYYNHMVGLCFHGVGHGLMFITSNDLPRSLDLCDEIPDGQNGGCYSGALMENQFSKAIGNMTDHPSEYHDPTDPTFPCRILKPHQQETCYSYEAVDLLNIYPDDFEAWFEACQTFPKDF